MKTLLCKVLCVSKAFVLVATAYVAIPRQATALGFPAYPWLARTVVDWTEYALRIHWVCGCGDAPPVIDSSPPS